MEWIAFLSPARSNCSTYQSESAQEANSVQEESFFIVSFSCSSSSSSEVKASFKSSFCDVIASLDPSCVLLTLAEGKSHSCENPWVIQKIVFYLWFCWINLNGKFDIYYWYQSTHNIATTESETMICWSEGIYKENFQTLFLLIQTYIIKTRELDTAQCLDVVVKQTWLLKIIV